MLGVCFLYVWKAQQLILHGTKFVSKILLQRLSDMKKKKIFCVCVYVVNGKFVVMKKRKYVALNLRNRFTQTRKRSFVDCGLLEKDIISGSSVSDVLSNDLSLVDTSVQVDCACPVPVIHNIVSTSFIRCSHTIDLCLLSRLIPYSFYDRSRFAAITIRMQSPNCTTLLFSSGKLVVTGGRDWYECVLASLCVCKILCNAFPSNEFKLINCEVQNIVAHVEMPINDEIMLDLQSMYNKLELNCLYQRQMFPGLIYRPESSPVVLLCFYSGKIVITGGKTLTDVYEGWAQLWPIVTVFLRRKQ